VSAHLTVLKHEAVDALLPSDGVYVDCTFGRGGHSREVLGQLGESGRLIAFDRDEAAEQEAASITDQRFTFVRGAFSQLEEKLAELELVGQVDGVLMDLGVSSPQLDTPERGFSFRFDAALDMRMDTSQGPTAAQWLAEAELDDITYVLRTYGEERFARRIAKAIVEQRETNPIETTADLVAICERCVPKKELGKNPATRTFQAIRIEVNQELEELKQVLDSALKVLKPGGRLVVISFHSLEDRIAKQFIRKHSTPPSLPKSVPVQFETISVPLKRIGKAVFASDAEVADNPRARSAVMRIAEKV